MGPLMMKQVKSLNMFVWRCFAFMAMFGLLAEDGWGQKSGGTAGPVAIDSIGDVIVNWTPDRRLFIKGSIGVPATPTG